MGFFRDLFRQFNFGRYTYGPHKPPPEEFKRLCQARQWGASKIRKHKPVEKGKDLRGSLPGPNLIKFFRKYEYQQFTYNLDAPIQSEFRRLAGLRGWGEANLSKVTSQFYEAVALDEGGQSVYGAGPNAIKFFREYEYQLFTYDSDASVQSEFKRLVGLRGWGKANLSKVTKQFNKATALDAKEQSVSSASKPSDPEDPGTQKVDLLADWLKKQECRGYRYRGGLPELEFKKLVRVKRWEWYQARREEGIDIKDEAWKDSDEFERLRTEFYEIVEKVFNLLLDRFRLIAGFTPWQVLVGLCRPGVYSAEQGMVGPYGQGQESVGLYGQGQKSVGLYNGALESMGKEAAKPILQNVFINIFDFLEAFQEILRDPPTTDRWELLKLLRPLAIELEFHENMKLGVYSALTNRVFPLEIAKRDGTLVLLLHHIREFLDGFKVLMKNFKKEAGDELQEAEEEGRVGIRRLLLSREWASLRPLKAKQ